MCDVRKTAVRVVLMGLAAGLLATTMTTARAQGVSITTKRKQETHARRETNASRQARIQRTIDETYAHRWEVFGGGGYLRFRSGSNLQRNNEVTWQAAGNYFLNPKFSVIGDARGSFGNAKAETDNTFGVYHPQINEYTFMGGVGYRFYRKEKVAIGAQALGGEAWGIFSGGAKGLQGTTLGLWHDGSRPAVSGGLTVDYNIYPDLAFRITPTWIGTTFVAAPLTPSSSFQSNFGINFGVIYRFGHQ